MKTPFARTALATLLIVALGLQLIIATVHAASFAATGKNTNAGASLSTIVICTLYGPRLVKVGANGLPVDDETPLPAGQACPICGKLFQNALPSPAGQIIMPATAYYLPAPLFRRTLPPPDTITGLRPPGRAPPLIV